MSVIGSVFLGDRSHHLPKLHASLQHATTSPPSSPSPKQVKIDPVLALQLRLRWLEALIYGYSMDINGVGAPAVPDTLKEKTLVEGMEQLRKGLEEEVMKRKEFENFYENYDRHATFLSSPFALTPISAGSTAVAPTYDDVELAELESLLAELEPDLRMADRDLREIETLENRGVTAAGKLPEHESLKPRLEALVKAQEEDLITFAALEERIANILEVYASQVQSMSDLFVQWNDLVTDAEDEVARLEREKAAGQRFQFTADDS